jgi:hypothetical protein
MATEEARLFAPVPGLSLRPGTLGAFAPSTALSPNRVRPTLRAVRDTERTTDGIGRALSAGVTGENSPHTANQPQKIKTDRPRQNIFLRPPERAGFFPQKAVSWAEQLQLFRCWTRRFSGDAAKPVDQPLHAMADGDRGMSTAHRELRARDAFEFELNE